MTLIQEKLFDLQDLEYKSFSAKLIPTVSPDFFIGVRVPLIKNLAKEIRDTNEVDNFLESLPHQYHEENVLHMHLVSLKKDYDDYIIHLEKFLPYVDNWAVCDMYSPKCLKKKKSPELYEKLLNKIKEFSKSTETYTIRYGIGLLMSLYLDDDFSPEILEIPLQIKSDEYYVNMMIAWFYATALAKQWDETVKIIESKKLDSWTHNKAIQKAKESFRVSDEHKEYLMTLKK